MLMPHPLVLQLRFTRSEFQRALAGLSDADARRRFLPMNCVSWNIGHLAWQEQRYWLLRGQGQLLLPQINDLFAYGAPAAIPAIATGRDSNRTLRRRARPRSRGWEKALEASSA